MLYNRHVVTFSLSEIQAMLQVLCTESLTIIMVE